MAPLSSATENRILVAGLGISACVVLGLMRYLLTAYRDSAIVKESPPRTQYITQNTEDSLKPDTLEKLVASHSYGIQEVAARIIADRAIHDSATLDVLLWELTRPDHDRRVRAMGAMLTLTEQSMSSKLDKPKVWSALIRSLEYCVTDYTHENYDPDFNHFEFRDIAEKTCLAVMYSLMTEVGPDGAIKAGFISKWLAKEPWGTTEEERQANFASFCRKDSKLSEIAMMCFHSPPGLRQLIKTKLIPESAESFEDDIDTRISNGDEISGQTSDLLRPVITEGGPRIREQSAEERRLRRRHREAMVLNDGVRPIVGSDIIERDYRSPIEERQSFTDVQRASPLSPG